MRDSGVSDGQELILSMDLLVQNIFGHIDELKQHPLLTLLYVLFLFNLHECLD
jgi:hypothetical protein